MNYSKIPSIRVFEVGLRDGLQNEPQILKTSNKLGLIDRLSETGIKDIELTAFANPDLIPALYDHKDILTLYKKKYGTSYSALIFNYEGYINLRKYEFDQFSVVVSASNTHNIRNINKTISKTLEDFNIIAKYAQRDNKPFRAYLSCVFGCPYEGYVNTESIINISKKLVSLGASEISISDTIGAGTHQEVSYLFKKLLKFIPAKKLAFHAHGTRGMAMSNICIALKLGIRTFDSAFGGLGGCPYAYGASGNISTEDLVSMLYNLGYTTNINLDKLCQVSLYSKRILNRSIQSKIFAMYNK
jgi:hydroxymethylglutaryl-CoA lyase